MGGFSSFFTDLSSNPFHEHSRLRQPAHHCFCNHFLYLSAHLQPGPLKTSLDFGVTDMDTTLPSPAFIFRSPSGYCVSSLAFYQVYSSMEQICPAKVSQHLPTCFYGSQTYLNFQPSLWGRSHLSAGDLYGQQKESLSPVSLVFSGSPTTDSAVTSIQ